MCRRNCEYRSGKRTDCQGQGVNDMICAYHSYGPGWKSRTAVLIEELKTEGIGNPERTVLNEMLKSRNCLFYEERKTERRPSTRPQEKQPPLKPGAALKAYNKLTLEPKRRRKAGQPPPQPHLCEICGREIVNKAPNSKYCEDCADRKREEYTSARNKEKYRKKKMRADA